MGRDTQTWAQILPCQDRHERECRSPPHQQLPRAMLRGDPDTHPPQARLVLALSAPFLFSPLVSFFFKLWMLLKIIFTGIWVIYNVVLVSFGRCPLLLMATEPLLGVPVKAASCWGRSPKRATCSPSQGAGGTGPRSAQPASLFPGAEGCGGLIQGCGS